jgi:hemerythrin-like domain-containing protein
MVMTNKPIKRSIELVPLSKEHHDGLLLCWKIRTGLKKGASEQRIADYVLYFFDYHLKQHFKDEEDYVFSVLPSNDNLKIMALEQHDELYKHITELKKDNVDSNLLLVIADKLDKHIRYEERELFPYIESMLSKEQLKEVGTNINIIHTKDICLDWADQFWLNTI